jgi:FixJ family two-component response regulator
MPGMRGPQLAAELTAARPELRVLLVSGYAAQPLDEPPGAAFLAKPFKPDALLDAVAGPIEGAQAARARASRPPR